MAGFFDVHERLAGRGRGGEGEGAGGGGGKGVEASALSVAQLTAQIDKALKTSLPASVLVRGEVSNFNFHRPSGNVYFTLKDPTACIDCVMFRDAAAKLKFKPTDGMEMLAAGQVRVYGARGRYQLYTTSLMPLGQGALELAFQQLKAKLFEEGLFEAGRKRGLPKYPTKIALVTSRQTAALQDMFKVLRKFPHVQLCVYHVPVQGDGSAEKIAAAIDHLSREGEEAGIELIILGRGGGSLEDLWEFNEECVARAMARCRLPVVTGIGHEVDVSIADLVADYHAHTPTEAARVVTAYWGEARDLVVQYGLGLRRAVRLVVADGKQRLMAVERHELFRRPADLVNVRRQRVDELQRSLRIAVSERVRVLQRRVGELAARLEQHPPGVMVGRKRELVALAERRLGVAMGGRLRRETDRVYRVECRLKDRHPRHLIALAGEKVNKLELLLAAYNPMNVLKRGYTITTLKKTGAVVKSAESVKEGDVIVTRFADGVVESAVEDGRQGRLFE